MRGADRVVVNSKFTKGIVEGVWSELGGKRGLGVIYPCVDAGERERNTQGKKEENSKRRSWAGKKVALSINRFERKKDVGLAIKAFAGLKKDERAAARLVIAGIYEPMHSLPAYILNLLQEVMTTESKRMCPTTKSWKLWRMILVFDVRLRRTL